MLVSSWKKIGRCPKDTIMQAILQKYGTLIINKQPIKDTDTDKKRHARGWKIKIFSRRILLLK